MPFQGFLQVLFLAHAFVELQGIIKLRMITISFTVLVSLHLYGIDNHFTTTMEFELCLCLLRL
jgi:hypothetical protein